MYAAGAGNISLLAFYKPDEEPFGILSNWHPSSIKDNGMRYAHVEQMIMAAKAKLFDDDEALARILAEGHDPAVAKKLGRGVKNYDEATWADARENIARRAVKLKFDQNPELWRVLEYTGNIALVEAAKWDRVWGGGITIDELRQRKAYEGANLLGRIIAEYRDSRVAAKAAAAAANANLDQMMQRGDDAAAKAKRAVRFAPVTDDARAEELRKVKDVRAMAFAPVVTTDLPEARPAVHPVIVNWQKKDGPMNLLEFGGGRKRPFNVAHYVREEGGAILVLDVLEEYGQGMDATCPEVIGYLTQHVEDEKINCMHGAQMGHTWSPSHCLGQDGQPPIGQYRSIGEPQGKSSLSGERAAACRKANIFRSNMLAIGVRLTAKGRSVSLESSPSCADPSSPQYVSYGGYDTSEHFSYFDGPEMAAYIRTTGSILIIVWRCAATPHESDNGYRKVMAFLVNPVAYERAKILRSLAAKTCKHPSHRRLRGNDENGVPHCRHAEEYPPLIAEGVKQMHTPVDGEVIDVTQAPSPARKTVNTARAPPRAPPGPGGAAATRAAAAAKRSAPPETRFSKAAKQAPPKTRLAKVARGMRDSIVFLVCIVAHIEGGPFVLLNDGALPEAPMPGGVTSAARTVATEVATTILPTAVQAWAGLPFHYAAMNTPPGTVEHVIALFAATAPDGLAMSYEARPKGLALVALSAVCHAATRINALHAIQYLADLHGDGRFGAPGEANGLTGIRGFAGVGSAGAADVDGRQRFAARQRLDETQTDTLRSALADEARRQAAGGDLDMASYLDEACGMVRYAPAEEVGDAARAAARGTPPWLKFEPFRDTVVRATCPLTKPQAQPPATGAAPESKADLLDTLGLWQIADWFERMLKWMDSVVHPSSAPKPLQPGVLIVGQDRFLPHRRGIIWDCRRERDKIIVPLDFTAVPESQWDTEYLRRMLADYPCRESVSHLCDGADYKADLPLSFCFTPHLLSIADADGAAYAAIYKDLERLKEQGYYEWFTDIPFAPWGLNGQGTRPKPPDPVTRRLKFRRIVSGSNPYDAMAGSDGITRPSVNTATRRPYAPKHDTWARAAWRRIGLVVLAALLLAGTIRQMPSLWRHLSRFNKERKPRALDIMWDLSIMAAIAAAAGLPLYVFVDDFAEFFYQFRLATHCLWYCGIVMLDPEQRRLWCIVELVLAMGFAPSSNVAQMGSEAFLFIFDILMAEADEIDPVGEAELHWIMAERQRRHGGTNGRPRRRYVYTDDGKIAAIGTARFVRAVMMWRVLLRTAKILAAEAYKRQLGTHALYLGVRMMVTLGYASVPEAKLLKAINWMRALREHRLDKETMKRCLGLLVHLVFLDATMRATTAGLWRCTARHRNDPVRLTESEDKRAERWQRRLEEASAVELTEAVRRTNRRSDTSGGFTAIGQSDACREKTTMHAALGGYSHSVVWRLVMSRRAAEILPISAGEYLAFIVHLIVNEQAHASATRVLHALDNINALLAIVADSARAAIMQAITDHMQLMPTYQRVKMKLLAAQWFGARLVMADAASRGYLDVLHAVATALHIKLVFVEPPQEAYDLVHKIVDMQERLLLLEKPSPPREPNVLRGSIASLLGRGAHAPAGVLEVDATRPYVLGNMMWNQSAHAACTAYVRMLQGESIQQACGSGRVYGNMAHVTMGRVAAAISAVALFVRSGGDVVLRDDNENHSHTHAQCAKVESLATTYLQRPAMHPQMGRLAMLAAGVHPRPTRASRHRHLLPVPQREARRVVRLIGLAATAPGTLAAGPSITAELGVTCPMVALVLFAVLAFLWMVPRITKYCTHCGTPSTDYCPACMRGPCCRPNLACHRCGRTRTSAGHADAPPVDVRRTGLLGGARNTTHRYLLVGNSVNVLHRHNFARYVVLDVDTAQACAYMVRNLSSNAELRVDLRPDRQRAEDELLERVGEWQLLPGSRSIVPFNNDSYVCVNCLAESTHKPCVICCGNQGSGHALVGQTETVIVLNATAVLNLDVPPQHPTCAACGEDARGFTGEAFACQHCGQVLCPRHYPETCHSPCCTAPDSVFAPLALDDSDQDDPDDYLDEPDGAPGAQALGDVPTSQAPDIALAPWMLWLLALKPPDDEPALLAPDDELALMALPDDMLDVMLGMLGDAAQPQNVVNFSSASKGCRVYMQPTIARLKHRYMQIVAALNTYSTKGAETTCFARYGVFALSPADDTLRTAHEMHLRGIRARTRGGLNRNRPSDAGAWVVALTTQQAEVQLGCPPGWCYRQSTPLGRFLIRNKRREARLAAEREVQDEADERLAAQEAVRDEASRARELTRRAGPVSVEAWASALAEQHDEVQQGLPPGWRHRQLSPLERFLGAERRNEYTADGPTQITEERFAEAEEEHANDNDFMLQTGESTHLSDNAAIVMSNPIPGWTAPIRPVSRSDSGKEAALLDKGASRGASCSRNLIGAIPGTFQRSLTCAVGLGSSGASLRDNGSWLFAFRRYGTNNSERVLRRMQYTPDLAVGLVFSEATENMEHGYGILWKVRQSCTMESPKGTVLELYMARSGLGYLEVQRITSTEEQHELLALCENSQRFGTTFRVRRDPWTGLTVVRRNAGGVTGRIKTLPLPPPSSPPPSPPSSPRQSPRSGRREAPTEQCLNCGAPVGQQCDECGNGDCCDCRCALRMYGRWDAQLPQHARPNTEAEGHRGGGEASSTDKDGPPWQPPSSARRPHAADLNQRRGTLVGPPATRLPALRATIRRPTGQFAATQGRRRAAAKRQQIPQRAASALGNDMRQRLSDDKSPFALRPTDAGMLERMGLAVHGYAQFGANAGTLKGETSAWLKYWQPFCDSLNTPAWRTAQAQEDPTRESWLQMAFAIWVWQRMKPRSNSDEVAQVQSSFNVLGHVRRTHSRRGYNMPPPTMLAHVARGMSKQMLLNYGKHSLVPTRAEPFTADQNSRMLDITAGTQINGRSYDATTAFWRGWRVVDTFANQSGERKAGIIGHELGEYNRSDILIVRNGAPPNPDPSPEVLRSMGQHPDDRIIVRGGPSKADAYNRHFGASTRVFKFNRANTSNFAAAIVDFELAFPLRGAARNVAPLFVQDGKHKRWTASAIDRTLDGVMLVCLTPEEMQHKTFHSKRVWLASALKSNKHSGGEIQALVHWRSPDSIRIYGRMDEIYQADCRERASTATFTVMNATSLPQLEPLRYTAAGGLLIPKLHDVAPLITAAN